MSSSKPTEDQPGSTIDLCVAELLQEWLQQRNEGTAVDASVLIDRNPALQPRLGQCLESLEILESSDFAGSASSPPAFQIPEFNIPDFKITGLLGRGGMGIVYEAVQESLDRKVALKILPLNTIDPMAAKRFWREAETAAALHHTNIVPVYGVGRHEGVHWYAMQRIEGQSLTNLLSDNPGGIDLDKVVRIGIQSASALDYAHSQGVIHRDIKPGNLLLADENHVWLTDFGLARRDIDETATVSGAMLGTPRYMSPETVFTSPNKPPDHRSDIYSLGATLYELATGKALFDGPTPLDVLQQIRTDDPPTPTSVRPGLPRDLEVVLQTCLAKDPKERYQSAADLQSDLEAIRAGQPIQARGVPWWTLLRRKIDRNSQRLKWAASAVASTLVISFFVVTIIGQHKASSRGRLKIAAAGGPFTTSLYRIRGDHVDDTPTLTMTVPMQSEVDLEAGEYALRLSSHGAFNESARVSINANRLTRTRYVDRRVRGTGIPIEGAFTEIVHKTGDGELLVTLDANQLAVFRADETEIFRIDTSFIDDENDFAFRANDGWTNNSIAQDPYYAKPRRVMREVHDLGGNGTSHLVITARTTPSLAAIGFDGTVLWTKALSLPPLPESKTPPNPRRQPTELPSVMEVLSVGDVDDDGTMDLLANVVRANPDNSIELFLVSVSGRNGDTIAVARLPTPVIPPPVGAKANRKFWPTDGSLVFITPVNEIRPYQNLDSSRGGILRRSRMMWEHPIGWSGMAHGAVVPTIPPVKIVTWNDQTIAVSTTDRTVDAWDVATGRRVGQPIQVPFTIAAAAIRINRGDEQPPSFVVWSLPTSATNPISAPKPMIAMVSPIPTAAAESASLVWKTQREFRWDGLSVALERADFPMAVDLDGDGVDELLVSEDRELLDPSGRLICLDTATGSPQWKRGTPVHSIAPAPERIAVLRDFDDDGVRDIAVASIHGRREGKALPGRFGATDQFTLFVDLISGRDGHRIRFWQESIGTTRDGFSFPEVDRVTGDSDSVVEVSVTVGAMNDSARQSMIIRLDTSNDQPMQVARGLTQLGDGDFCRRRPGPDQLYDDRVFAIAKPQPSILRVDAHKLIATWNGSNGGARMLVHDPESQRLMAIDVATGNLLWAKTIPNGARWKPAQAIPVLACDGNSSMLVVHTRQEATPSMLLDAETGRIRCQIAEPMGHAQQAFVCDHDPDTIWILAYASFDGTSRRREPGMRLVCVDVASGQTRWEKTVLRSIRPRPFRLNQHVAMLRVDCDNDGIVDVIVPDDGKDVPVALIAISGADGKVLWKIDTDLPVDRWSSEPVWPLMITCGPKSDKRIVLVDGGRAKRKLFAACLLASTGELSDKRPLDVNWNYRRASWWFCRLQLQTLDTNLDWPRISIAFPASSGAKSWLELNTSAKGFSESDTAISEQPNNGSTHLQIDVNLDGSADQVQLTNSLLTCRSGDQILWEVDAERKQFDRVHEIQGLSPMLGLYDEDDIYSLVSLADGETVWTSEISQRDVVEQRSLPTQSPVLLPAGDGLCLVRVTREGIRSVQIRSSNRQQAIVSSDPSATDPRLHRRLPISPLASGQTLATMLRSFTVVTVVAVFALWLPIVYLWRGMRLRRFTLAYLLLAPAVTATSLFAWDYLLDPVRLTVDNLSPRESWQLNLLGGSYACAFLVYLRRAVQDRHGWLLGLCLFYSTAMAIAVVCLPSLAARIRNADFVYNWGIEDVVILFLINFMMILTTVSFVWYLAKPIWKRLQKRIDPSSSMPNPSTETASP